MTLAFQPTLPKESRSGQLGVITFNATRNRKMIPPENPRIIALFDVDGTLTIPRGEVEPAMMEFMLALSKKIMVGIVGGSDLPKQEEQLGVGIANVFPYNFSQNGLVAYKDGELQEIQTIAKYLGEDNVKRIVNWVMKYLADLDIPVKVSFVNLIGLEQVALPRQCL